MSDQLFICLGSHDPIMQQIKNLEANQGNCNFFLVWWLGVSGLAYVHLNLSPSRSDQRQAHLQRD